MAPGGVQTRLTAPGDRTRASCTRTATAHRQITPSHSPEIQRPPGTAHP
jgi:hypothetical protein